MSIYYISSQKGNNKNSGLSQSEAWRDLYKLSEVKILAGDKILLEKGSIFENQYLHLCAKGSATKPILISSYGSGNMPSINCNGSGLWYQDYGTDLDAKTHTKKGYVSSAILLYDCEYITVENIAVSNRTKKMFGEHYHQADKMNRTGVAIVAQNAGALHQIHLKNMYIHDIQGNIYDKHMNNGGIYATALKPDNEERTGVAQYKDFTIEDCVVNRSSRCGIAVGYTYNWNKFTSSYLNSDDFKQYAHTGVVIKNNYVKNSGGDAITTMYCLQPICEHNVADSNALEVNDRMYKYPGDRKGKVAAGIWPWKCKNAIFRYNEVVDTKLNQDGMAYDADSGDGTIYEYNYSCSNEGGAVMFCLEEAVNNTFVHNLSFDDLGGTISPAGNPDAYIAHNTFYIRENTPFLRKNMSNGKYLLEDNEIIKINF